MLYKISGRSQLFRQVVFLKRCGETPGQERDRERRKNGNEGESVLNDYFKERDAIEYAF